MRISVGRDRSNREGWRERVKRAAAPRQRVTPPEKVTIPWIPPEWLITNMVELGCPRRHAVLLRGNPQLTYLATRLYFDRQEAEAGDAEAKARIDHYREAQARLRALEREALGKDPDRDEPVKQGSKPIIYLPKGKAPA